VPLLHSTRQRQNDISEVNDAGDVHDCCDCFSFQHSAVAASRARECLLSGNISNGHSISFARFNLCVIKRPVCVAARSLLLVAAVKTSPLCIDIFKNSEIEHLDELRENLIRAKPCRVIIDSRRDD